MTSKLLPLFILIMSMVIGCSTFKGGMPTIPFSIEEDMPSVPI